MTQTHIATAEPQIVCLIDTRFPPNIHKIVQNETDHHCYFNDFNSIARGVAIFIEKRKTVQLKLMSNRMIKMEILYGL